MASDGLGLQLGNLSRLSDAMNARRANLIVFPTYYCGGRAEDNDYLIGPGKALDPSVYCIVVPGLFGNGVSSSPSNAPEPWSRSRFPHLTYFDNVAAQRRLVERVCAASIADGGFNDGEYTQPPLRGLVAFATVHAGWFASQRFFADRRYRDLGIEDLAGLVALAKRNFMRHDANDLYQGDFERSMHAIDAEWPGCKLFPRFRLDKWACWRHDTVTGPSWWPACPWGGATMKPLKLTSGLLLAICVTALAAHASTDSGRTHANVDDARLLAAADDGANWLTYGRTYDEQRYSPLTSISDKSVGRLGLTWSHDLETARGQEATPIVVDGVMYVSTAWSIVKAFDAATGALLWSYDPQVPREKLVDVCCDAVNRGVAVYKGKVFVGTLAGHVVALDAATGKVVWDVRSIPEGSHMAITGAPRVVKGKVVIGAAGSEYFTRGYLAAFDAESGKEAWRFYTVPGDPSQPFEGQHLEKAAKTWSGDWWKYGGGGTVWDSTTYDPETDLIYFGTANAEPWNPAVRNTEEGDNLYTASIVAIRPDTGEYVWHYQETPEDRWDFDSNQQIIAATLEIDGKPRRVVLHAPKNGFFYVLDAKTGQFVSGTPFATVNWASGLDPVTGRPNVNPEAKYDLTGKPFTSLPSATGAHTWHPMSYSPQTGLVYIPTNEAAGTFMTVGKDWKPSEVGMQLGVDFSAGAMPADPAVRESWLTKTTGALVAWDPVARKPRWTVPYPGPINGGTLATSGNLVFQGTAGGEFRAYAADSGEFLWKFPTQTGVVAGPITYSVDGTQYVAVLAGWGGVWDLSAGVLAGKSGPVRNVSRMLVFKLDGTSVLPPLAPTSMAVLDPPPATGTPEQVADGAYLYGNTCGTCHGDAAIAGGLVTDLRHSATLNSPPLWQQIVHDGVLKDIGMVGWSANFTPAQIDNIRHYVIKRANEDKAIEARASTSR